MGIQMEHFSDFYREFLILCNRHLQMGVISLGKQETVYQKLDFQVLSLTQQSYQMLHL